MDERTWTDRAPDVGAQIDGPGWAILRQAAPAQALVSGDLAAAIAAFAPGADMVGFGAVPRSPDHAIRIARDRALLVTRAPLPLASGWHEGGFALSHAGSAHACLDLVGPEAEMGLAHGLKAPPPFGSPSAAVVFLGWSALVTGLPDGFRLWVPRAALVPVCTAMQTFAGLPGRAQ